MTNHLKIKITGKNPDYFLRKLISEKINIYFLEKEKDFLIVLIHFKDYDKVKKMKTSYKIEVLKRYGINKYQTFLKKDFYILLFIGLGIFLNILLSHMIFEIEVIHPNQILRNKIQKDLEELGLKKYRWKINYTEKEKIKQKVLEKEKNLLEWLEIEEEGTKYKVTLEERKQNREKELCTPRSITTRKNAIILEIQATEGEIVKKKNDYVTPGEIIISGEIHNKEEVVSKKCAQGKVYGETWYHITVTLPTEKKNQELTNRKVWGFSLNLLKHEFFLHKKFSEFQKKEYNIIESKIIPFKMGFIYYQEIHESYEVYNDIVLETKALETASTNLLKILSGKGEILDKKVLKKTRKNSKIEVEVFVKTKEDITDTIEIPEE